jgi:hypothetical protein
MKNFKKFCIEEKLGKVKIAQKKICQVLGDVAGKSH